MILRSLKMKNVKCYEDVKITFSTGKNVIVGSNGSGKSTILQSILYSMFSVTPPGTKDQLVRANQSSAEFELHFEHEGRDYQIDRKLRVNGGPVAYLTDKIRDDVTAETQTGVDEEVAHILQISKEVFRDVVLVQQGEIAEIIDMTSSKRKKLFDKLLGIHDFEQAFENCRRILTILESKKESCIGQAGAYRELAGKIEEREVNLREAKAILKGKTKELTHIRSSLKGHTSEYKRFDELDRKSSALKVRIGEQEKFLKREREQLDNKHETACQLTGELSVPKPKKEDLISYETSKTRAEETSTSTLSDLEKARKDGTDFLKKSQELETSERRLSELQDEVDRIKTILEDGRTSVFERIPRLQTISEEEWIEEIAKEIKSQTDEKGETRKLLEKAGGFNDTLERQMIRADGVRDNITEFKGILERNASNAQSEIGDNWREFAEMDLRGITPRKKKIVSELEGLESELKSIGNRIARKQALVDQVATELKGLSDSIGKKCPKCKQIVDEAHAKRLKKESEEKLQDAEIAISNLGNDESRLETISKKLRTEQKEIGRTEQKIQQARVYHENEITAKEKISEYETELSALKKDIKSARKHLSEYDIKQLEETYSEIELLIESIRECKGISKRILSDKKQETRLEGDIQKLEKRISDLKSEDIQENIEILDARIETLELTNSLWNKLANLMSTIVSITSSLMEMEKQHTEDSQEYARVLDEHDPERYESLKELIADLKESKVRYVEGDLLLHSVEQCTF